MSKVFYRDENVMLIQGDCLEVMPQLKRKFDAIITDPPYGTTACKWDTVIPFDRMWGCLTPLIKDVGAICLFGCEPFSSCLRCSNLPLYKYDWTWKKEKGLGFLNAKKMPLRDTENISVFGLKMPIYFPQMSEGRPYKATNNPKAAKGTNNDYHAVVTDNKGERYPLTTLSYKREYGLHPTQKPVALIEYLIKTYTSEGETVLDFTCGSGTTLIAALNTGRRAVGIEMDEKYCQITVDRIKAYYASKENKA